MSPFFLDRCRHDRADYAKHLRACERGELHIGDGLPGGVVNDRTAAFAKHLRSIIAGFDVLILDMEADVAQGR